MSSSKQHYKLRFHPIYSYCTDDFASLFLSKFVDVPMRMQCWPLSNFTPSVCDCECDCEQRENLLVLRMEKVLKKFTISLRNKDRKDFKKYYKTGNSTRWMRPRTSICLSRLHRSPSRSGGPSVHRTPLCFQGSFFNSSVLAHFQ